MLSTEPEVQLIHIVCYYWFIYSYTVCQNTFCMESLCMDPTFLVFAWSYVASLWSYREMYV